MIDSISFIYDSIYQKPSNDDSASTSNNGDEPQVELVDQIDSPGLR